MEGLVGVFRSGGVRVLVCLVVLEKCYNSRYGDGGICTDICLEREGAGWTFAYSGVAFDMSGKSLGSIAV